MLSNGTSDGPALVWWIECIEWKPATEHLETNVEQSEVD